MPHTGSRQLIVKLEGYKLPPMSKLESNKEIRLILIREVAKVNFNGALVSRILRNDATACI